MLLLAKVQATRRAHYCSQRKYYARMKDRVILRVQGGWEGNRLVNSIVSDFVKRNNQIKTNYTEGLQALITEFRIG